MVRPEAWLAVGRIRRPHGIHGEVVVEVETDFPERMESGLEVGVGADGPGKLLQVERVRFHKAAWLLSFAGFTDRDAVEALRGLWVYLPPQERSALPENYYYEHELRGLDCVDREGGILGRVKELVAGGGGALLEVLVEHGVVLVPFRSPIVVSVDLDRGVVVLDPPAGLFGEDAL